jgi:hypothetical protein
MGEILQPPTVSGFIVLSVSFVFSVRFFLAYLTYYPGLISIADLRVSAAQQTHRQDM